MRIIYKVVIVIFLIIFPISVNAHVQHYADLNRIEFDIYRNNIHIGKHIFSFDKSDGQLAVVSEINFKIKKLGIVLYKYHVKGTEIYEGEKLIKNRRMDQISKKIENFANRAVEAGHVAETTPNLFFGV